MVRSGVLICVLLLSVGAFAAPPSAVLPQGIWHPSLKTGVIYGVSDRYDNSGSLESVGRLNQAFTGDKLAVLNKDFKQFSNYLAQAYPHSNYVNQLSLGSLEFEANAQVTYYAPILAYGLTKSFSLGVGIPFVHLSADVQAYQTGVNNVRQIHDQIAANNIGDLNPQLAQGLAMMENVDLVTAFHQALTQKGYIVPTHTEQSVMGDAQVVGIYQYFQNKRWLLYETTTLNLPTGPEDNPDDFMDIPMFHQSAAKFAFNQDYLLTKKWTLGSMAAYQWKAPDTALKRVPEYDGDVLPNADRKERVRRDLGDVMSVGGYTHYWISRAFNLLAGYEYSYKGSDSFSGDRGYDYSLMEKNTKADWHKVNVGVTFSTIDLFLAQEFVAPFQVLYTYSDVIAGTNVDRQIMHDFTLRMFF